MRNWLAKLGPSGPPSPDWPARFEQLARRAHTPALRSFYARGTVAADTPLSEVPFVALDLETTGLNPTRHGIVSIGLVPFTLARIRCRESRYWVVRPRRHVAADSITIHHITHDELENAPDLMDILGDLLAALTDRVAVVHYRPIERRFLDAALRIRLHEGLQFPVVDTMSIEARFQREAWLSKLAVAFGGSPVSLRLAACRSRYRLPMYRPHHALTDALATAELLQAQVAYRFSADTPIDRLWL